MDPFDAGPDDEYTIKDKIYDEDYRAGIINNYTGAEMSANIT